MARLREWAVLLSLLGLVLCPGVAECRTLYVKACIANLVQIDGAVQQWALERKLPTNSVYSLQDPQVLSYCKGSTLPVCMTGGRYLAGKTVSDSPSCTRHGTIDHTINAELNEYLPKMRQRFLWAWIIVIACSILISPLSKLPLPLRRGIMAVLPAVMVLLVYLFWLEPQPGLERLDLSAKPNVILTGYGLVVSLIFARQQGRLRLYGLCSATCLFLLLILFLA